MPVHSCWSWRDPEARSPSSSICGCSTCWGFSVIEADDFPCAERYWKDALANARAKHSYTDDNRITANIGVLAMERGDYVSSSNYFSQALARAVASADIDTVVSQLVHAAYVEATLGHTARSIELLTRAQHACRPQRFIVLTRTCGASASGTPTGCAAIWSRPRHFSRKHCACAGRRPEPPA